MREEMIKYLFTAGILEVLEIKVGLEESLMEIGYDMGKYFIITYDFRPEISISELLYKVTYILMPRIYETNRILEKNIEEPHTFIITEENPYFSSNISLPRGVDNFVCDSIFDGVIKCILAASGFDVSVSAHNTGNVDWPNAISYVITLNGNFN